MVLPLSALSALLRNILTWDKDEELWTQDFRSIVWKKPTPMKYSRSLAEFVGQLQVHVIHIMHGIWLVQLICLSIFPQVIHPGKRGRRIRNLSRSYDSVNEIILRSCYFFRLFLRCLNFYFQCCIISEYISWCDSIIYNNLALKAILLCLQISNI